MIYVYSFAFLIDPLQKFLSLSLFATDKQSYYIKNKMNLPFLGESALYNLVVIASIGKPSISILISLFIDIKINTSSVVSKSHKGSFYWKSQSWALISFTYFLFLCVNKLYVGTLIRNGIGKNWFMHELLAGCDPQIVDQMAVIWATNFCLLLYIGLWDKKVLIRSWLTVVLYWLSL